MRYAILLALLVALLAVGTWFLQIFHSLVLVPFCSAPIPFLPSSNFCRAVSPMAHILNIKEINSTPKYSTSTSPSFLCSLPLLASINACQVIPGRTGVISPTDIQKVLQDQFSGFHGLVDISMETPKMIHDIREFGMALQDLTILVMGSDLKNRDALVRQLVTIKQTSELSRRRLQAYSKRLGTAIGIYLASAEHTLKLIDSETSVAGSITRKIACLSTIDNFCATDTVYKVFLHTLQTFEFLLQSVSHSNGLTDESLEMLSGQLDVIRHLSGEEATIVTKEIGELLGSLWTRLGGNRKLIANAHQRYTTLNYTSVQTKAMQRLVVDIRVELYDLQVISDTLRAYAAHTLLLEVDFPKGGILTALSEGCQSLRNRLKDIGTRAASRDLPSGDVEND